MGRVCFRVAALRVVVVTARRFEAFRTALRASTPACRAEGLRVVALRAASFRARARDRVTRALVLVVLRPLGRLALRLAIA